MGLPRWLSGKEFTCQCRRNKRCGFKPYVGKILWKVATHSSILAWETPWTEEPGGLQSMGWQRVRHGLATKQQQQSIKHVIDARVHREESHTVF